MARPKGAKDKRPRKRRKRVGYAVAYKDRRTYSLTDAYNRSEAIKRTMATKRRGSNIVTEVRKLTPEEEKIAQAGKWVKSRPKHFTPDMRGKGPKSNAYRNKYERG